MRCAGCERFSAVKSTIRIFSGDTAFFGFYGYPCDVSGKSGPLRREKTFSGKKYVTYDGCSVSLFDYSLVDVDLFKQLVEAGRLAFYRKVYKTDKEVVPVQNGGQAASDREIFDQLPSAGNDRAFSLSSAVNWLKDGKSVADMVKKGATGILSVSIFFLL